MKAILISISIMTIAAANLVADTLVTVNEQGLAYYAGDFNVTNNGAMSGSYRVLLPGGGTQFSSALTYNLPFAVSVYGDVLLTEETGSGISDVIRFLNNGTQFVFFSDKDPGEVAQMADTGLPYQVLPSSVTQQLVYAGPEIGGYNGIGGFVDFTPDSTQPGYVAGMNVTYRFISETPEPGSLMLVALLLPFGARILRTLRNRKA